MKATIKIIILSILACGTVRGQDPQFSQFYANPLYLAPSFAGSTAGSRVAMNYRDQWPNLAGRFVSYSLSVDHYFAKYNSGLGILALRDQAGGGKLNTTNLGFQYSYKIKLNNRYYLQPGIQAYYTMQRINFQELTFADQFLGDQFLGSSVETPPDDKINHIDFSTSLLAYSDFAWAGFNFDHMMKVSQSLADDYRYAPVKLSVFGGAKIMLKERLQSKLNESLTLAFNYKTQAMQNQLDMGAYYYKFPIIAGLWYRGIPVFSKTVSHDAITLLIGYKHDNFSFGYSYDLTIGNLITSTGGAHELSLMFTFDQGPHATGVHTQSKRKGAVPCPEF
jgi:type IX secretion system PorP/SprF family membrane protein